MHFICEYFQSYYAKILPKYSSICSNSSRWKMVINPSNKSHFGCYNLFDNDNETSIHRNAFSSFTEMLLQKFYGNVAIICTLPSIDFYSFELLWNETARIKRTFSNLTPSDRSHKSLTLRMLWRDMKSKCLDVFSTRFKSFHSYKMKKLDEAFQTYDTVAR